jgi:hypothetical protein
METFAKRQFPEAQAAYEGLEIKLPGALMAQVAPLSARQRDVKYADHG